MNISLMENSSHTKGGDKTLNVRVTEVIIFSIILILAVFSRFYNIQARVMSHDENSHVYYSWRLYKGEGFSHDPLMHGPLQFHMIALSYFMFGDNDFTARIPAALCSIATVGFMWFYRKYLGRIGALIAAFLMLVSPYMLYYGRYVRNEAYVAFFGVVTLWAILRYLDTGKFVYTYILIAAMALHFTAKETAFIYTAQLLIFLGFFFIYEITAKVWESNSKRNLFLVFLAVSILLMGISGGILLQTRKLVDSTPTPISQPTLSDNVVEGATTSNNQIIAILGLVLGLLSFMVAFYFLIKGYSWNRIKRERSFGLLILLGTFVLPQLTAFPVNMVGWTIPTNATQVMGLTLQNILQIATFFIPLLIISLVIGILWNPREWLINAAIFYSIFTIFYTTLFTNGAGFFTGMIGSLGYWLEQQGVNRGSQPWYYFWLVQIPIYEYVPAIGTIFAFFTLVFKRNNNIQESNRNESDFIEEPMVLDIPDNDELKNINKKENKHHSNMPIWFFLYWTVTSLIAYTVAGEKMPWLTVHIAFPMILCASWAFGKLVESINWETFRKDYGWLFILLFPIFAISLTISLTSLLGSNPPFQGKNLDQLSATSTFLMSLLTVITSGAGILYLSKKYQTVQYFKLFGLTIIILFTLLNARTAFTATYINYDYANELLVYAHSARGVKTALSQIEEISQRTTDGLAINVAYDNETSYPYWWYLRNYKNAQYYGAEPTRSLRESPIILVGDANFGKIEPIVGKAYDRFDYIRLWWPNQDYFGLTWERVRNAITNPAMRNALFQIWLNRDYSEYGKVTGKDMSLPNWSPSAHMRLYIRKDIVGKLWNYGSVISSEPIIADPYEGKQKNFSADKIFGIIGQEPGQFLHPRGIAVATDGSVFVTDSDNNRIQHLSADGKVLKVWGSFGDITTGDIPGGMFNQPWGIAVSDDGFVYVADTWNHRIQKFTFDGEFVKMWGYFGQAESPDALWGPRDIAIDAAGNLFVSDTGNKRIVVFDADGNYITEFGSAGYSLGQFDEPVGIAVDNDGNVYVADTWNQRIQVFIPDEIEGYIPKTTWDISAWYGQSLDNKPYLAVDLDGRLFATDPEGYRVLQFETSGEFIQYWGDLGDNASTFNLPTGIAVDRDGGVWIVDSGNGRIMHFDLSEP